MDTPFLKANWRYLAITSFAIDPAILRPLVPPGTELDSHAGRDFVSIAGFLCQDRSVFGVRVPFHRNQEAVSLRFYVRRKVPEGWRRGVVPVREIVPGRAAAWAARCLHGGSCMALPMRHSIERTEAGLSAEFSWRRAGAWESLKIQAAGAAQSFMKGSIEEFIADRGWSYGARLGGCGEYSVQHPRWSYWPASAAEFKCDVAALYGPEFAESLSSPSAAAFIADGSEVIVGHRAPLAAQDPADLIADSNLPGFANPAA
jgi:hypothetical protein